MLRKLLRFDVRLRWLLLACAVLLAVRAPFTSPHPAWWIAAAAAYYFLVTVGFSVGMHRYFCHRAFRTSRAWETLMLAALVFSLAGVPFTWCRAHLQHHMHADTDQDPYKVKLLGWRSLYYRYDPCLTRTYVRRSLEQPLQRLGHNYYNGWVLLGVALLAALGGLEAVTFLWAVPVALIHPTRQFFFHYSIHTWGYRTYATADDSRNNWLVALLTGGEGWHNNHHHDPSTWSFTRRWWEIDPGGLFIWCIRSREPVEQEQTAQASEAA